MGFALTGVVELVTLAPRGGIGVMSGCECKRSRILALDD
jgi:hypothetical protein